jgi:hypothetical protein
VSVIGYARVSTADQNAQAQADALREAGCERIFIDHASGARPQLDPALDYLRSGDILVVWKLDRLGRFPPHLIEVVQGLGDRGVELRSLTEAIEPRRPPGGCCSTSRWRSRNSSATWSGSARRPVSRPPAHAAMAAGVIGSAGVAGRRVGRGQLRLILARQVVDQIDEGGSAACRSHATGGSRPLNMPPTEIGDDWGSAG